MANTVKKSKEVTKKTQKTKATANTKHTSVKSSFVFKGTADLYLLNTTTRVDCRRQFNKSLSPIYGVEEYFWTGVIKKGEVRLVRKDLRKVPVSNVSNSGITLVGKAISYFKVENAMTINSLECSDQVYNYCNEDSKLVYVGDDEIHTVYVRIYDNTYGNDNDRWVTLSIE